MKVTPCPPDALFEALAGLLRSRLRESRTTLTPSMDALESPAMLHACAMGARAWILACVTGEGRIAAALETAGYSPSTGELALSVLRGTDHQQDLKVEVADMGRRPLRVTTSGRRRIVNGLAPGRPYRIHLSWPGGGSLPVFASFVA